MSNIPTPEEIVGEFTALLGAGNHYLDYELDLPGFYALIRSRDAQVRAEAIEETAKVALDFMRENHERRISVARADEITKRLRALSVPK